MEIHFIYTITTRNSEVVFTAGFNHLKSSETSGGNMAVRRVKTAGIRFFQKLDGKIKIWLWF